MNEGSRQKKAPLQEPKIYAVIKAKARFDWRKMDYSKKSVINILLVHYA